MTAAAERMKTMRERRRVQGPRELRLVALARDPTPSAGVYRTRLPG
jgi:hypothetical protein